MFSNSDSAFFCERLPWCRWASRMEAAETQQLRRCFEPKRRPSQL